LGVLPMTHHVEGVALLEKTPTGGARTTDP
jgi:hypothetical protein